MEKSYAKIAFDMDKFPNADYTSDLYSVANGEVTFLEGFVDKRRVESAQMRWVREIEDIFSYENVQLVNAVMTESDWVAMFPQADASEYMAFLGAVAQYPAFCSEYNEQIAHHLWDLEKSCKRELATLIAHIQYESGDKVG